jgi:hypothetical protein
MNRVWYILTTRCAESDRLRSLQRSTRLTWAEYLAMTLHTSICASCRAAARQLQLLDNGLDRLSRQEQSEDLSDQPALDQSARDRLLAALQRAEESDDQSTP